MRAVLAGAALAAFVITPSLADYYIIQEPTTKRCRIVEERPAFALRLKAECVLWKNAEKAGPRAGLLSLRSVNVARRADRLPAQHAS
jgi:hypothetical protein